MCYEAAPTKATKATSPQAARKNLPTLGSLRPFARLLALSANGLCRVQRNLLQGQSKESSPIPAATKTAGEQTSNNLQRRKEVESYTRPGFWLLFVLCLVGRSSALDKGKAQGLSTCIKDSWLHMVAHACTWLHMVAHGYTSRLSSLPS